MLTVVLAVPVAAAEKVKPKLTSEAKDGVQTTQDNITKMKLKKAQQPTFTPSLGGPPVAPPPPAAPSIN
ncbi:MAG: hypothetical protein ACOZAM_19775 [Pseudomonadota bacterium]